MLGMSIAAVAIGATASGSGSDLVFGDLEKGGGLRAALFASRPDGCFAAAEKRH
jgi:hypothetical protein